MDGLDRLDHPLGLDRLDHPLGLDRLDHPPRRRALDHPPRRRALDHPRRFRRVLNLVNGSTALGAAVALAGRARLSAGPRGLVLATGFRAPFRVAPAFTLGDVVLSPHDRAWLEARPALLRHEERHAWQYVACLGLPMLPLYVLAAGWSWLRAGDPGTRNPFEVSAGLADGGYPAAPVRRA